MVRKIKISKALFYDKQWNTWGCADTKEMHIALQAKFDPNPSVLLFESYRNECHALPYGNSMPHILNTILERNVRFGKFKDNINENSINQYNTNDLHNTLRFLVLVEAQ